MSLKLKYLKTKAWFVHLARFWDIRYWKNKKARFRIWRNLIKLRIKNKQEQPNNKLNDRLFMIDKEKKFLGSRRNSIRMTTRRSIKNLSPTTYDN